MQASVTIKLIAIIPLWLLATAVFSHETAGWAAIHWHVADFAGLAPLAGLTAAALWLARRQKRSAKT